MQLLKTIFRNLFVIEPKLFPDERGYFFESFHKLKYSELGITDIFVQDNESQSCYGTLRGLHFQKNIEAQSKLIRVTTGAILDVVVDLRYNEPTYLMHYSIELTSENKKQLYVPRGFAHGFVVLSESATIQYKCDNFYNPKSETGLKYDDPKLNIDWKIPKNKIIISTKDQNYLQISTLERNNDFTFRF